MPTCKKCGDSFPNRKKINGKQRSLNNRRYCLSCSPFGKHNTKQIGKVKEHKPCQHCGKFSKREDGRTTCYSCLNRRREQIKGDRLYQVVGTGCWVCNYDRGREGVCALDFHHMKPSKKEFELNARNIGQLSWKRVIREAKKCVLICCRCHRELHGGLIDHSQVQSIYRREWQKRRAIRSVG